jgi:demethylmenaquinone methyltransferase / 2-methoxy-6-polyprenyl-1,4-benzoquinol methylase
MPLPESRRVDYVRGTFDRIARRYDLLNRVISFHLDTYWRKKAAAAALVGDVRRILDLGTGTGDLALTAARQIGNGGRVVGIDFSHQMLRLALDKSNREPAGAKAFYLQGTALTTPFRDGTFDAIMSGFVLRNVSDLQTFFREAYRVLRGGGRLATLDMFPPSTLPFSFFYSVYFHHLMPWLGACLARDRKAYRYLSNSVRRFHSPEAVATMIADAGFKDVKVEKFLNGAVCLHTAGKHE